MGSKDKAKHFIGKDKAKHFIGNIFSGPDKDSDFETTFLERSRRIT